MRQHINAATILKNSSSCGRIPDVAAVLIDVALPFSEPHRRKPVLKIASLVELRVDGELPLTVYVAEPVPHRYNSLAVVEITGLIKLRVDHQLPGVIDVTKLSVQTY